MQVVKPFVIYDDTGACTLDDNNQCVQFTPGATNLPNLELRERLALTVTSVTGTFGFGYGTALELLLLGAKVQRAGWNGKNMWLAHMSGMTLPAFNDSTAEKTVNDRTAALIGPDTPLVTDQYISMWTAQGTWQPGWLPSQADQFATDWQLAPDQVAGKKFFFWVVQFR